MMELHPSAPAALANTTRIVVVVQMRALGIQDAKAGMTQKGKKMRERTNLTLSQQQTPL